MQHVFLFDKYSVAHDFWELSKAKVRLNIYIFYILFLLWPLIKIIFDHSAVIGQLTRSISMHVKV